MPDATTPARRRSALLSLACAAGLAVTAATVAPTASADDAVTLTPLGTVSTGAFDEGASEIVAYDATTRRAFTVNAFAGTVDVIDISDPTSPRTVGTLATPGANSVDVHDGIIAVAEQASPKTERGTVAFFDAATLAKISQVQVGALPDMLTFTPDGSTVVVANEGEPEGYCDGQVDPVGSISVITVGEGAAAPTVREAGFAAFDSRKAELIASGVRIFGPGASVSQDLEPEYAAVSADGTKAWVTLQEANAFAIVDLASATVTDIVPLGLKDHSVEGNGLDASDKDDAVNIATWPVKGMYLPDSAHAFTAGGADYVATANEGDAREYDCFEEETRIKDVTLDPTAFPDAAELQADAALGRLAMTSTSPRSEAGYTELHTFGARSMSIWDASGRLVFDSGDAIERLVAERQAEFFNSGHDDNDSMDSRSDAKGPEPEGIDIGVMGGRSFAFVGLERQSGIVVMDVTDPRAATVAGFATNRDFSGDPEAGTAGDLGPEGILFVPASDSPTGSPLLLVGNEVSGTTTIWQVDGPEDAPVEPEPEPTTPPVDDDGDDDGDDDEPTTQPTPTPTTPVRGPIIETDLP